GSDDAAPFSLGDLAGADPEALGEGDVHLRLIRAPPGLVRGAAHAEAPRGAPAQGDSLQLPSVSYADAGALAGARRAGPLARLQPTPHHRQANDTAHGPGRTRDELAPGGHAHGVRAGIPAGSFNAKDAKASHDPR